MNGVWLFGIISKNSDFGYYNGAYIWTMEYQK